MATTALNLSDTFSMLSVGSQCWFQGTKPSYDDIMLAIDYTHTMCMLCSLDSSADNTCIMTFAFLYSRLTDTH